jgi:hypothetical protein
MSSQTQLYAAFLRLRHHFPRTLNQALLESGAGDRTSAATLAWAVIPAVRASTVTPYFASSGGTGPLTCTVRTSPGARSNVVGVTRGLPSPAALQQTLRLRVMDLNDLMTQIQDTLLPDLMTRNIQFEVVPLPAVGGTRRPRSRC